MFEDCNECDEIGCISQVECDSNKFRTLDETKCVQFC